MNGTIVVGTYAGSGGRGLTPLMHDATNDAWSAGEPFGHIKGASFGAVSGRGALFVNEEENRIGLFDVAAGWRLAGSCPSGGEAPCHVAVDGDGEWGAVANYASGTVGLLRMADALDGPVAVHQNTGCGPNPERQDGPHAHWVGFTPDGSELLCVDLGCDRIFGMTVDREHGGLGEAVARYRAPAGTGPRHLAFHPDLPVAYLLNELAATVTVLYLGSPEWQAGTVLPLPSDGRTLGGGIAIDPTGRRLYATSRGHDSIATYALDPAGEPVLIATTPSGGASPRHLCLAAELMFCANEQGGSVSIFRLDESGRPTALQVLDLPGAALVMQLPAGEGTNMRSPDHS